jgi:hypothetical protein
MLGILGCHEDKEVNNSLRVAPFVVVPCDELDETRIQSDSGLGVKDRGIGIADEIGGNDFLLSVVKNSLQKEYLETRGWEETCYRRPLTFK